MVLTIARKLVLSFLGLTLVVLVATLGLARWSFERGFMDYANALEQERLQMLTVSLAQQYQLAGGTWDDLTERAFQNLLHNRRPDRPDLGRRGPPRPRPGNIGRLRPPPLQFGPPTALFDSSGDHIAGAPLPDMSGDPISVTIMVEGKNIGELRSAPRRRFDSPQETAFSRQQLTTSLLIGAVSLALAIVVSLLLTRVLLAPIRRMLFGVSELSNGNYANRLNESRKDELGQLMADLDQLAHTLEENRDSRQRWLADISHELRTPVTVLTGEIETLKDGIRPIDMQQILSLDQEVTRLRRLIEDLYELSLSDIGGLRYSFSPVDILDSVSSAFESARKRAEEVGIELVLSGKAGTRVNGDARRLDQLFSNLVENALAYTDSPGRIEVAITRSGNRVSIRIQDTPPGISAEECEKLFEPLYRHDASRSRRTAGAGLGLAICRNIVEAHQGAITAYPSGLGGLGIHIDLPAMTET